MEYKCLYCNKYYKNDKTLNYHINKYHKEETIKEKKYICKYCDKKFSYKQSKSDHEKNYCKKKDEINNEIDLEKIKMKNNKLEIEKIKLKIKLKKISNKETKIINNNTINNIQNNTINIRNFMEEIKAMNNSDKLEILKSINYTDTYPIVEMVKKIYTDDRFIDSRNVAITNLRSNHALGCNLDIINNDKFEVIDKKYIIGEMIAVRKVDILNYLKNYIDTNKLTKVDKEKLKEYIYKLNDPENRYYNKEYKDHHDKINFIIYNSRNSMKQLINL